MNSQRRPCHRDLHKYALSNLGKQKQNPAGARLITPAVLLSSAAGIRASMISCFVRARFGFVFLIFPCSLFLSLPLCLSLSSGFSILCIIGCQTHLEANQGRATDQPVEQDELSLPPPLSGSHGSLFRKHRQNQRCRVSCKGPSSLLPRVSGKKQEAGCIYKTLMDGFNPF